MKKRAYRVLQIAHGHPAFTPGGTEIFAHRLHQEALARGIDSWYLGAAEAGQLAPNKGTSMVALSSDQRESVIYTPQFDRFSLQQPDGFGVLRELRLFLRDLKPTTVHIHHVLNFGLELVFLVRAELPDVRIVFTLHDYYAICANNGQLFKHHTNTRCDGPELRACIACLHNQSENDFVLRRLNIENTLAQCDTIVSPSHFLAEKIQGNLSIDKEIHVIENGYCGPMSNNPPAKTSLAKRKSTRFGFFGNISKIKGFGILLDAMDIAFYEGDKFELHVFGSQLIKDDTLSQQIEAAKSKLGTGLVFHGSYKTSDLSDLMAKIDCSVFPSIWWENAPLTVYESLYFKKPVIAFPIGGGQEILQRYGKGIFASDMTAEALYEVMKAFDAQAEKEVVVDRKELKNAKNTLDDYIKLY